MVGYQFVSKIIVYFKDKGTNLNTLAFALTNVVSCAPLQFDAPFSCTCFGHVMSKACQYAIKMILGWKHDQLNTKNSYVHVVIFLHINAKK